LAQPYPFAEKGGAGEAIKQLDERRTQSAQGPKLITL
jgi:hypothetical protein